MKPIWAPSVRFSLWLVTLSWLLCCVNFTWTVVKFVHSRSSILAYVGVLELIMIIVFGRILLIVWKLDELHK
jgi:uncharacterized membrane protein